MGRGPSHIGPQTAIEARYGVNMRVQATYGAGCNGMASNGLKIACAINAKSPRNGGQGLAIAYSIGAKKARAMAGLVASVSMV